MNCEHCGKPLKDAQYNATESLKSCPNCSKIDGHQHIYYNYPEAFGTTELRSTMTHPDGPQSYCNACRADSPETPEPINCEDRDG